MSTYLEKHPPRVRQYRKPRRATASGLIVVHTAESVMDTVGPDTGAENVAAFISRRTDYGSYHTLVDSDSIVRLVPYEAEAYGDGTGSNPYAIHISAALAAADWPRMALPRRRAYVKNLAAAAADAARWVKRTHGIDVPAVRVTRVQSEQRRPGFISHAERDPGRRTDPGTGFPWEAFLAEYQALMAPPVKVGPTVTHVNEAIRTARRDKLRPGLINRLKKLRGDIRAERKK